jgi:hypothetical protein
VALKSVRKSLILLRKDGRLNADIGYIQTLLSGSVCKIEGVYVAAATNKCSTFKFLERF